MQAHGGLALSGLGAPGVTPCATHGARAPGRVASSRHTAWEEEAIALLAVQMGSISSAIRDWGCGAGSSQPVMAELAFSSGPSDAAARPGHSRLPTLIALAQTAKGRVPVPHHLRKSPAASCLEMRRGGRRRDCQCSFPGRAEGPLSGPEREGGGARTRASLWFTVLSAHVPVCVSSCSDHERRRAARTGNRITTCPQNR